MNHPLLLSNAKCPVPSAQFGLVVPLEAEFQPRWWVWLLGIGFLFYWLREEGHYDVVKTSKQLGGYAVSKLRNPEYNIPQEFLDEYVMLIKGEARVKQVWTGNESPEVMKKFKETYTELELRRQALHDKIAAAAGVGRNDATFDSWLSAYVVAVLFHQENPKKKKQNKRKTNRKLRDYSVVRMTKEHRKKKKAAGEW